MKILSAEQIKAWDQFTIENEPILSIDLMERASAKCTEWIAANYTLSNTFHIFCGKGNNGGDGLAIARMLSGKGAKVIAHILEFGHAGTADFQCNLERLHHTNVEIRFIQSENQFPVLGKNEVVIDALLGSGLNRPLETVCAQLVAFINRSNCEIISIDIPSGILADQSSKKQMAIKANHTLSFQCYKLAFYFPENAENIGFIHIIDIGLDPDHLHSLKTKFEWIDLEMIRKIKKTRNRFSHKGNFGHALIIAGSYGKIGAATLSAKACLRSGVGLLTCHIPKCGYDIMQISVPEAMVETDFNSSFLTKAETDLAKFAAIGIGPGIGIATETKNLLQQVFAAYHSPMVIDADALNLISMEQDLLNLIPTNSILTPHPKEFERLFGKTSNDFERCELALKKAQEFNIIIILKGHHSFIASPDGNGFFNSTGNAGMATAGSGDVLTGVLTGLLAQEYLPTDAAILGVWLHGLAGELALTGQSQESMIASDIIDSLGKAFKF